MLRLRREIVVAAGGLFARLGYEGTTFSRVARAIGRPKSSIGYHLFPSKASLAEAVLTEGDTRWRMTDAALERDGVPLGAERLLAMLSSITRDVDLHPERAGALRLLVELPARVAEHPTDEAPLDAVHPLSAIRFARACIAAELAPVRPQQEQAVITLADLLVDSTRALVLCHVSAPAATSLGARLGVLWTSLLQLAGVPGAAAIVQRVRSSSRLAEIAGQVEAEMAREDLVAR
jgi:AcrR family transcriptional regulator